MTSLLSRELRREVRRLSFYRWLDRTSEFLVVLSIVISSFIIANHFSEIFIFENIFKGFFGLMIVIPFIIFCKKWIQRPFKTSLKEAAFHLEKKSSYFVTHPEKKGELISAALFTSSSPGSFEGAHRQYWENEIKFVSSSFFPSIQTLKNIFVCLFFIASAFYLKNPLPFSIPTSIIEWHASQFEIKPVGSSQWELKKGSVSGASGSLVRLKISQSRWLKTFVFIEEEKPDIILLTNSPKVNLERIFQSWKPQQVVVDATNYKTYIKVWRETCRKEKIPFHDTSEKGFYKL